MIYEKHKTLKYACEHKSIIKRNCKIKSFIINLAILICNAIINTQSFGSQVLVAVLLSALPEFITKKYL